MNIIIKVALWVVAGIIGVVIAASIAWFLFFKPTPTTTIVQGGLNTGTTQVTEVPSSPSAVDTTNQTTNVTQSTGTQKVFKIADGPVTGATFVQTLNPTTTLARYVLQENGHVLDQPLDIPGSLPRAVSNTTIPGTQNAQWGRGGVSAFLQYQDGSTIKTVSLIFPSATSSKSVTRPVEIQFLPDNATAVAVSPSGLQVAYLLGTASGSDGYIANIDGSSAKKIFSLGFSELLLSWPTSSTLLIATKSAGGVPGIVFSADTKTGLIVPLIYATGVTAIADSSFSNVVYRTDGNGSPATYLHNMKQKSDTSLSLDPIPEKCAWGQAATSTLYCATPLNAQANYLDQWHMGLTSATDAIISFMPSASTETRAIATPGSRDGGVASDIEQITVSPDDKYLLFVKKGDHSLWGVRLSQ